MKLWTFAEHYWFQWSPFLLAVFVIVRTIVRATPSIERQTNRAAGPLVLAHLIATTVGAFQASLDYETHISELIGLSFMLLAFVALGGTVVFRLLLPRLGLQLPRILVDLITAVVTMVMLVIVGKRAGFSVAGLITTSAVLTAVIGFSLQDTLGNIMGGLSVQMDKSIQVGDWITLGPGQPVGRVTEIRWRYTAMETRNWETVIIPNGVMVKSQVMILGQRQDAARLLRRQIDFFVDFRTPPTEVITEVETALRNDPVNRMAAEPQAQVLFFGVRDSFGHYCVRYWLNDIAVDDGTDSAVRVRVWYALRRADIPMSIPASSIFLTHETPERASRKVADELDNRMAALASVDLFRGLPETQKKELAAQLAYTPFAAGEAVTHEGDLDDGLYMIVKGEAIVRIGSGAAQREVARLLPGQFFGEMSLMTGEARTASVVAASDLECYRIDKPAFQQILRETPAVVETIAEVLATRRTALSAARDEKDDAKRNRMNTAKQDLLGRIRGFFGIDQQRN